MAAVPAKAGRRARCGRLRLVSHPSSGNKLARSNAAPSMHPDRTSATCFPSATIPPG